jgi:tetratricopeptide (TPR) repeat protein
MFFALFACDKYNPTSDTMQKIPNENNLMNEASYKAIQDAFAKNPDASETNYQMALYKIRIKDDSTAIPYLEKALQIDSTQERYYLTLSKTYNKLKKNKKALDVLGKMKGSTEKNLESMILAGELYYEIKEYNESIKILNKALKIANKDPRVYYWKASVEVARLDSANALKNLKYALKYRPNYYQAYNLYTELFNKFEMYNFAIYYANKGIKINPKYDLLYFNKAEAFRLKRFAEDSALFFYKKTFELNPKTWQASYFLGKNAFEKGKIQEAKKYLNNTLKYKEYPSARYYLGMCWYYSQNKEKALKEIQKAMKYDTQNLLINEWYWKIKTEIQQEKYFQYEDSIRKSFLKSLQIQNQELLKTTEIK